VDNRVVQALRKKKKSRKIYIIAYNFIIIKVYLNMKCKRCSGIH